MKSSGFLPVIAFDFSDQAISALKFARSLKPEGEIAVINVMEDSVALNALYAKVNDEELVNSIHLKFESIVIDEKLNKENLSFKISKGKVYQEISRYLDQLNNPLLLLGLNSADDSYTHFAGSNTMRILGQVNHPVILFSGCKALGKVERILLPMDLDNTQLKFDYLEAFLEQFKHTRINMVFVAEHLSDYHLNKSLVELGNIQNRFTKAGYNLFFEVIRFGHSEQSRITVLNSYMNKHKSDLVLLLKHKKNGAKDYNISAKMLELISSSEVPVIVLNN